MLHARSATLPTLVLLLGLGCARQNAHADADVRVGGEIDVETATVDVAADVPRDAPSDLPRDTPADVRDARAPEADVIAGCPPWAPILRDGACVECTDDDVQCPCGVCASYRCWYRPPQDRCGCVEPYSACVSVDGQVMCVQCTDDLACAFDCQCSNEYTCVEAYGAYCSRLPAGCKDPCPTGGCPDPDGHWSDLQCDPVAGCCASPDARCDDRAAFCTQAGSRCMRLRDLFGLTFATWLQGEATCARFATGYCTCDLAAQAACGSGQPGNDMGCCPSGQTCLPALRLFRRLVGDETAVPPTAVDGMAFCVVGADD